MRGARGLAGPGEKVTLRSDGFVLNTPYSGTATVQVRWSKYWTVLPRGCVKRTPDGFTQVIAPVKGRYVVQAKWSLGAALEGGTSCAPGSSPDAP